LTSAQLLESFLSSSEQDSRSLLAAVNGLDEAALNKQPSAGVWSPAQILDHLCIANGYYIQPIDDVIAHAAKGYDEVRHSFVGKFIIKALSSSKAPAPKQLTPRDGVIGRDVIDKWSNLQKQLEEKAKQAHRLKLTSHKVKNPFIPLVRMNGCDLFRILEVHLKYHLPRIIERSK